MFSSHTYTLLCGLLNGKNMAKKPDLMSWLKYTIFKLFLFIPQTGIIDSSRLPSKFAPSSDFNPLCVVLFLFLGSTYPSSLWLARFGLLLWQWRYYRRVMNFVIQVSVIKLTLHTIRTSRYVSTALIVYVGYGNSWLLFCSFSSIQSVILDKSWLFACYLWK